MATKEKYRAESYSAIDKLGGLFTKHPPPAPRGQRLPGRWTGAKVRANAAKRKAMG